MDFKTLILKHRGPSFIPHKTILCLDPGFTTGVCVFRDGSLGEWEQVTTIIDTTHGTKIMWSNLHELFERIKPDIVVCENYRIYEHKLSQHAGSPVDTLRLIGGIDMLCSMSAVPIVYQMATQAKGFVNDDKLKLWDMWKPGMRHSRDAIRHGCYYLLFNKEAK